MNIASVLADQPFAGLSVCSASEAAVLAPSRSWAQELGGDGMRVNVVSPGPIDTPICRRMEMPKEQLEAMAPGILQHVPLRRFGTPAVVRSSGVRGAEVGAEGEERHEKTR